MKTKTYILKVDLPGGYTKGMKVVKVNFGITSYEWETNHYPCPWNPEIETKFFEEVVFPKYAKGQLVWFTNAKGEHAKGTIDTVDPLKVRDKIKYLIKFGTTGGFSHAKVSEEKIKPAVTYFFINSKGQVHQDYTLPFTNEEVFRQLIGNYFNTKDEADVVLDKILKGEIKFYSQKDFYCR